MNSSKKSIEMLLCKVKDYGKTTFELFKLNAIDKTADIVSSLVVQLAILILIVLFALCVNIGVALWIGELLGKSYYGFFVLAGFYAIAALLIYACKAKCIKTPIRNNIIKKMLQQRIV
jgi:hypothetical protein